MHIACETYLRLAALAQTADNSTYSWLNTIMLQRKNGILVAVATDAFFGAVEFVEHQPNKPDEMHLLQVDATTLAQCEVERHYGGQLFVTNENGQLCLSSSFGWRSSPHVVTFSFERVLMADWRDWVSDNSDKMNGSIFVDVDGLARLAATSPSGKLIFPRVFDVHQAITVKDANASNWLGFFRPNDRNTKLYDFGHLPTWAVMK